MKDFIEKLVAPHGMRVECIDHNCCSITTDYLDIDNKPVKLNIETNDHETYILTDAGRIKIILNSRVTERHEKYKALMSVIHDYYHKDRGSFYCVVREDSIVFKIHELAGAIARIVKELSYSSLQSDLDEVLRTKTEIVQRKDGNNED